MIGAFVTAFEAGIRLAALVLVVAIVGAAIIGRIIEGELSGSHAVIGLLFVSGLLIGVIFLWNSPLVFALFLLAAGLAALWAMAQTVSERQLMMQIRAEDEARYKAAIERDPKNAAAWSALGDLYLEAKRYDDAISCYEKAVQLMPNDPTEKRKLMRAKQLKSEAEAKGKFCPQCKSPTPLLAVQCPNCGYELSVPVWVYLLAAAKDKSAMAKVSVAFVLAFLAASVWLTLFFALNSFGRAILVLATLAAICVVALMELRK
jgi:tetratricopeptide (TPR) repeat protein